MEQGWDPEVKRYFRKIIYSFSMGMLWLTSNVTLGIYFELGCKSEQPVLMILFYLFFIASLAFLLRYYYRTWKK